MFQMMGVFAELERALIQERVRAGMARAKAEGKHVGRPRTTGDKEDAREACKGSEDDDGVSPQSHFQRSCVGKRLSHYTS
jgi:DNA invertase Pin-like site-specific DNA recombinase